jgi:hypothetical protein
LPQDEVKPRLSTRATKSRQRTTQDPDDYPGQKDLNYLSLNYASGGDAVRARFGFDDTSWSGNNTGDGCVLFDQNTANGKADVAFCVTVEKAGVFKAFRARTPVPTRGPIGARSPP